MMISPEMYHEDWKEASYPELMEERDGLVQFLKDYEEREVAGGPSSEIWDECPTPDVVYQMSLLYLSELCRLMHDKYNQDYVWGDCSLREDYLSGAICRPGSDQKHKEKR